MNLKEFKILTFIESNPGLSQRNIALKTNYSLGTVNSTLLNFHNCGFVNANNVITSQGLYALEPFRVKRAILLAAGFGSRMVPITLNTPKPLVRVHGKPIIETLLDALYSVDIKEIYIVRGYLKEQFDVLLKKYPTIKFIDNPVYNETNNISSVYYAKEFLKNTYVLESDLVLINQTLITKYQFNSNYIGIKTERTDDWCFFEKNGIITKVSHGGINCFQTVGIVYVSEKDGIELEKDITDVYCNVPGGKEAFWGFVPNVYKAGKYKMGFRECLKTDIVELDSFKELKEFDSTYNV